MPGFPTIDDCVHCGLCLPACPTHEVSGREIETPRGRIAALRRYDEDAVGLSAALHDGLDDCLLCRACESACPAGISMEALMANYRAARRTSGREPPRWRARLEDWLLTEIFPDQDRLEMMVRALAIGRRAARWLGIEVPAEARWQRRREIKIDNPRSARGHVRYYLGCVNRLWFRDEAQAAIRCLTRNRWHVELVEGSCCGALHEHAGLIDLAARLRDDRRRRLLDEGVDYVVNDTAGCAAHLAHPRDELGARTIDTVTLLVDRGFDRPAARLPGDWVVQAPCHERHGRVPASDGHALRTLLSSILECGYRELPGRDHCCGAAGFYSLRKPGMSRAVGESARKRFADSGATGVVNGNAGCLIRWDWLLFGSGAVARHPVVLLDQAYRRA